MISTRCSMSRRLQISWVKGKVLGRILNPALGLLDKRVLGFGSEIESFREQAPDRGPLGGIKIAVHARRLDQERGNG
jgi:hypothetical protein